MGSKSARELLELPVRLDGIRLGRCVDVVLDDKGERVIGVVVLCGDDTERFLVLDAIDVLNGEIAVSSALLLLEEVDFYRQRGRSLRDLRGPV
ncbi:MAG TPA: PRC-barrel domain-containing protein [Gaiellaceae bacterium]